jgi:hypothetical protein
MAMKKTFGGDSPLQQGVGKSFWTLPISGQRRQWIAMCFWKIDRVFRFWDFYFRAPGSLVVLSFPQPLNFSLVFPSL